MVSTINQWMASGYQKQFTDREGLVLLSLESLTVEEAQALRISIRAAGAELRVTKSRLAKVALKEIGVEFDDSSWGGMCGMMVGSTEATIGAAKAIEELWGKNKERKVTYRGAVLDGSRMTAAESSGIAKMHDKDTLRAMMCGALTGSARQLATLLREVPASTARVLQARAEQGESAS
ncbi:MAG: 50S ribosomal protein L10 [Planctomycetota bacterium]|nr:50S ribosomal protein L10 [Planctomycetota bacterium]